MKIGILFSLILGSILFVNYYPHYYALRKTPPNHSYSGQASWFDPWDITNYFATIKLSQKEKSVFLNNPNTTDTSSPTFIYPLYTLTGILFPKVNNIILYQFLAVICGILLAFGIYFSTYLLTKNSLSSLYTLFLVSFGAGLGFLFPLTGADLNIPGVTFFSTFQKPHEAVAALLYISSLTFFYLSIKNKNKYYLSASAITSLLLIPIYPYRILSLLLIISLFSAITGEITKKKFPYLYLGALALVVLPPTLVYLLHFLSSGFATLQSYNPPPISLLSLLLGYGLFTAFYVYQLFSVNKKNLLKIFLNIWIAVSLGLSILTFGIGRLYLSGLLFPLTILSILSFKKLPVIAVIFLLISTPSTFYIFSKRIAEVKNNNTWYYLPDTTKQGLDFLGSHPKDGVLALPPLSNFIPAYLAKHVYFGIRDQTPDYDNKYNNALSFYSGKMPEIKAQTFLKSNLINLIVVSNQEKQLGKLSYPFLTSIYQNKDIEIFDFSP